MAFCAPYCNAYIPDLSVFYNTRPGNLSDWQGTTGREDQDAMAVACRVLIAGARAVSRLTI